MRILLLGLGLLPIFTFCFQGAVEGKELLAACGDDKVLIIDSEASEGTDTKIIWKWTASESEGLPEVYQRYMRSNDDCKPVDGGKKILVTSSSGGVVLVDRENGKSLFYAHVPNAHSAEYLPGGRLVVALSTSEDGNSIQVFDESGPDEVLFMDPLHSGHGVVWIPPVERLFALGGRVLRSYSLENWNSGNPSLKLENSWDLPGDGGHDLISVSENRLILTTVDSVWNFDIRKEEFSAFVPLEGVRNVKSVNYDEIRGKLVYTKAEESWWTENIYCRNPDKVITIPGVKLYKVRVLEE